MIYLTSLYYKKSVITGANKRFDEIGIRLTKLLGKDKVKVILIQGERPDWCEEYQALYIRGFRSGVERLISNICLSILLTKLEIGTVISDFMPLPFWGLKRHKHYQLIHDLRNFTAFSRQNIGMFTSRLQARSLNKSENIITVSEFSKQEIIKFCNIEPNRILVSYNGVNVDNYVVSNKIERDIDFLYIATFESRKNHKNLLLALQKCSEKLNVVLIGRDLGELGALLPLIDEINLSTKVAITIIDSITDEELISYYNRSKNFISPSLLEGFGMPLIEAAICGCNIVCSDLDVFKEILKNHATYFSAKDVDSIYEGIEHAIQSDYRYSQATVDYAYKNFSWDNICYNLLTELNLHHNDVTT